MDWLPDADTTSRGLFAWFLGGVAVVAGVCTAAVRSMVKSIVSKQLDDYSLASEKRWGPRIAGIAELRTICTETKAKQEKMIEDIEVLCKRCDEIERKLPATTP